MEVVQMSAAIILRRVKTDKPWVALTFDDGPHPRYTAPKLEILRSYQAAATFFVLGQEAAKYPKLLAELTGSGYEIGSHSHAHPNLARLGPAAIRNDLAKARSVIGPHRHFRPPYGAFSKLVQVVAGQMGYAYLALWNVDPRDWSSPHASTVVSRVLTALSPGAIIVLHDPPKPTVDALPGILDGLKRRGFSAVTLNSLLTAGTPSSV